MKQVQKVERKTYLQCRLHVFAMRDGLGDLKPATIQATKKPLQRQAFGML